MEIHGLVKTSLVDYPGHIAATLFLRGCNMRCPFCHNSDLVLKSDNLAVYSEEEIFDFIRKRKGTLEAVCITGGEPTLHPDLLPFIMKLKNLGLKIKLDTNGLRPDVLSQAIEQQLLDFVAMDIKNSPSKYASTSGVNTLDLTLVEQSISILKISNIPYEFRTTVIKELHSIEDILLIGKWLEGSKKYVLQKYTQSLHQLSSQNFTSYDYEAFLEFEKLLVPFFEVIELRGF